MDVIVCVKQILDPEAPPASFKVDVSANKVVPPPGVPPVLSTFDEYAVEAALRIKEAAGGKVTAISMGNNLQRDVVKKPLSMGADELILLEDVSFEGGDSWSVAYALALAIKKIGKYDLIFCGRQAADWDSGQVGSGIAEILGLPVVAVAKKVEVANGKVKVERMVSDGYEVVETSLPAVVTLSNEHDEPRYPSIKGIMAAKKVQPTVWKPADIGVKESDVGSAGRKLKLLKLYQPVRETKCEIVHAETPEETAANLAKKLREAKII